MKQTICFQKKKRTTRFKRSDFALIVHTRRKQKKKSTCWTYQCADVLPDASEHGVHTTVWVDVSTAKHVPPNHFKFNKTKKNTKKKTKWLFHYAHRPTEPISTLFGQAVTPLSLVTVKNCWSSFGVVGGCMMTELPVCEVAVIPTRYLKWKQIWWITPFSNTKRKKERNTHIGWTRTNPFWFWIKVWMGSSVASWINVDALIGSLDSEDVGGAGGSGT